MPRMPKYIVATNIVPTSLRAVKVFVKNIVLIVIRVILIIRSKKLIVRVKYGKV